MTVYQRFESLVGAVLTVIVTCVVIVALFRLAVGVIGGRSSGLLDLLKPEVVQAVFGEIMTVLLIAILALARRLILLDLTATNSVELFGSAWPRWWHSGGLDWLMRERDDRPPAPGELIHISLRYSLHEPHRHGSLSNRRGCA